MKVTIMFLLLHIAVYRQTLTYSVIGGILNVTALQVSAVVLNYISVETDQSEEMSWILCMICT